MAAHALNRHVVLIGFMGAGKSTIGSDVARRLGREFRDIDQAIEAREGPIAEIFAERGEAGFREIEAAFVRSECARRESAVIAVGGGAVETRDLLRTLDVFTVHLDVDVETAWSRVRGSRRPLARDEAEFRQRYEQRAPLYEEVADAVARDGDDVVLAAGGVRVGAGLLEMLGELVPRDRAVALVTDAHVGGIYGADAQLSLGARVESTHELPAGEAAKTVTACSRLWTELSLDRSGTVVAIGGGSTTDAAGFAAATYLRGIDWVPVPTTLVGQVDAAIGAKTAINLPHAKNRVGAFHWPIATVVDPVLLQTLPERERASGLAEVVKMGLLAGEPLWELPEPELVRRCAALKTEVCLRDPHEEGERRMLNLGHTFAHALEAASDYRMPHGQAVALGLLAALRLSGLPTADVEEVLAPRPVRVDRERAWEALRLDKKAAGGRPRLVLLEAPGSPRIDVELSDATIRAELGRLIAE